MQFLGQRADSTWVEVPDDADEDNWGLLVLSGPGQKIDSSSHSLPSLIGRPFESTEFVLKGLIWIY